MITPIDRIKIDPIIKERKGEKYDFKISKYETCVLLEYWYMVDGTCISEIEIKCKEFKEVDWLWGDVTRNNMIWGKLPDNCYNFELDLSTQLDVWEELNIDEFHNIHEEIRALVSSVESMGTKKIEYSHSKVNIWIEEDSINRSKVLDSIDKVRGKKDIYYSDSTHFPFVTPENSKRFKNDTSFSDAWKEDNVAEELMNQEWFEDHIFAEKCMYYTGEFIKKYGKEKLINGTKYVIVRDDENWEYIATSEDDQFLKNI